MEIDMKRKICIIFGAAIIIMLTVVILINKSNKLSTIEGVVLEISKTSVLINESGYESGECYLIVSDNTEIYIDDDKVDVSSIEVGQTIQATYSGGIEESYPSKINEVMKIIIE